VSLQDVYSECCACVMRMSLSPSPPPSATPGAPGSPRREDDELSSDGDINVDSDSRGDDDMDGEVEDEGLSCEPASVSLPFSISRLLGADFERQHRRSPADATSPSSVAAAAVSALDLLRHQHQQHAAAAAITSLYSHPAVLQLRHPGAGLVFAGNTPAGVIRVPAHRPQGKTSHQCSLLVAPEKNGCFSTIF